MSTWIYLQCLDHNPPLLADDESGQHLYDLAQIFDDLANREAIIDRLDDDDRPLDYYQRHTARFLCQHTLCRIAVVDEYGKQHQDPRQ